MERCCQESSGVFVLPAAASLRGLGCSSMATEGLGDISVLRPSPVGHAGEVAEEGLADHWLNHGQGSD